MSHVDDITQGTEFRNDILESALAIMNNDRQAIYGDPYDAHLMIASLWTDLLGHEFTAHDVALALICLKLVRAKNSGTLHLDSYVDIAAYASIAGDARNRIPDYIPEPAIVNKRRRFFKLKDRPRG